MTPEELFLAHLPHIKQVAAHHCRKHGLSREETEDFVSWMQVKLIEDDYAVFRKFKGKSSLKTYLTVVIGHLFQDYLNHLWRKWRPTEEAKRLGPLAIQLERLLHRDRLTLAQACEILVTNHHVEATRQELEELAEKLPHRNPPRQMEGEGALESHPSKEPSPGERIEAREGKTRLGEILEFLKELLAQLPAEDALLVQMMSSGHKISMIARTLDLEQKPLYRRLEKILNELRQELERRGVRPEEISELLSIPEGDHEPPRSGVVKPVFRPSHKVAEPRRPEKGADFGVI